MAIPKTLIEGKVVLPNGSPPSAGSLVAKLSQSGSALDVADSQRVAAQVKVTLGTDGALPAGFGLCPNDAIVPSGTYYRVHFETKDERGVPVSWDEKWQVATSVSAVDIGSVTRLDSVAGAALTPSIASTQAQADAASASASAAATSEGAALAARTGAETARTGAEAARAAVEAGTAAITTASSSRARSYLARAEDVIWAADFVAADGTDETTGLQAAINKAMATGKELRLPEGTIRSDSQLVLPNDGATPPKQRPLRIVGAGATTSGRGASTPNGGTALDLRYGGTYGKILTTGLGLLEITGVTFIDGSGGSLPWLYTTNTTLDVHNVAFIGSKVGAACDQDCIILGGTVAVEGQGDPTHGFQGYGTVIERCYFHRIRRAVYGRTYANAVVVAKNKVWSNCGSNLADGAAIEFDSVGGGYSSGNTIVANLLEVTNYPYGVKLGAATQNAIGPNHCFDATGTSLAAVRLEASATYNEIRDGFLPPGLVPLSDATTGPLNTHFAVGQGYDTQLGSGGALRIVASDVLLRNGVSIPVARFINETLGTEMYRKIGGTASNPTIDEWVVPNGAAAAGLGGWRYYGVNQGALQVYGSAFAGVEAPNGDLKIRAKTGSTTWIGDIAGTPFYFQNSTKRFVLNDAAAEIRLGAATGPVIKFGTGSPLNVIAAPIGSLYVRTDGGAGTSLYVKESGTDSTGWVGK